ncbi:MAG: DUF4230 domain-containing protein [Actinomycetota bacterium]|nr:DUF4230 domain-containing protein [Actinomycetota bacterium]
MGQLKRRLGWISAIVVVMAALLAVVFLVGQSRGVSSASSNPTITEIQRIGELVVLRVTVADVLEDSTDDFKGVWIVRGDALVAVDMHLAELKSTDESTKHLEVLLPQPRVIQPRVDHQKTTTYDISKRDWWNPFVGSSEEFSDQGMLKAQEIVESASAGDEVMDQARDQAELVLTNMYRLVGWEIDVVWQD